LHVLTCSDNDKGGEQIRHICNQTELLIVEECASGCSARTDLLSLRQKWGETTPVPAEYAGTVGANPKLVGVVAVNGPDGKAGKAV
jgi:hypothetical protein